MDLNIDNLKNIGAFTGAPVKKEITWKHGGDDITASVYVRRLSYQGAVDEISAAKNKQDPVACRIASCICDAEGKPVFTPADITGESDPERGPLDGNLVLALLAAIG